MNRYNVTDLFFEQAKNYPDLPAIIHGEKRVSFGQLSAEVRQTSAYFQSLGIKRGDRVLVFVPMGIDLYRTVLALFDIGAVVVFLDEWVSRERLAICCKLAKCKAWIGGWKVHLLSFVSSELRKTPVKLGLTYQKDLAYQKVKTSGSDTALITFTTGSTGIPKAAIRTHFHLQSQFDALIEKIAPKQGEIDMTMLPIVLLINLGAGCTSVIAPYKAKKAHKLKPEFYAGLMKNENVDRLISSPYFALRIAEYCKVNSVQLPNLRKVFTGGAPVFPEEAKLLSEGFTSAKISIVFGSTEAEPISSIDANVLQHQSVETLNGLCVGDIHRTTSLVILPITSSPIELFTNDELQQAKLKENEIGEICVSGPHVLENYLDNPEAVRQNKFEIDGVCWHRTGDSGFMDGHGVLYLTGRAANVFQLEGKIISPFIVENNIKLINEVIVGTILKINDLSVCFVELKGREDTIVKIKDKYPFIQKFVVGKIPRDPRHFSKIDYGKLKELYLNNHK